MNIINMQKIGEIAQKKRTSGKRLIMHGGHKKHKFYFSVAASLFIGAFLFIYLYRSPKNIIPLNLTYSFVYD